MRHRRTALCIGILTEPIKQEFCGCNNSRTAMFWKPLSKQCFRVNLAKAFTLFWLIPAVSKAVEEFHQNKIFKSSQGKSHKVYSSKDYCYTKGQQIGYQAHFMGPKIMFHIVKGQKLSQFHAKSVTVCSPVIPLQVSGKSELISLLRYDLHYGRNCIFILLHHPLFLPFRRCHILSNQLLSKVLLAHLFFHLSPSSEVYLRVPWSE